MLQTGADQPDLDCKGTKKQCVHFLVISSDCYSLTTALVCELQACSPMLMPKMVLQAERGQKEISAARVREVESQLSGAQTNLKAERLLLQQASRFLLHHLQAINWPWRSLHTCTTKQNLICYHCILSHTGR